MAGSNGLDVSLAEIRQLMEHRGSAAVEKIKADYGGVTGLCAKLRTDANSGLPEDKSEIDKRRKWFGRNDIPTTPPKSFVRLVWEALKGDIKKFILAITAIFSVALSFYKPPREHSAIDLMDENAEGAEDPAFFEGVIVLIVVATGVLVVAFADWNKERVFRDVQSKVESEQRITVIRGGKPVEVVGREVVVGDIANIKKGDVLRADGLLIQSSSLEVDESRITGNSDVIEKSSETDPVLLSGTCVMDGSAKVLITAVGANMQMGATRQRQITKQATTQGTAQSIEEDRKTKSATRDKLSNLVRKVECIGLVAALITLLILVVRRSLSQYLITQAPFQASDLAYVLAFAMTSLIVWIVADPLGIPLAVTLVLTHTVERMLKDHCLVRRLVACENVGRVTSICADIREPAGPEMREAIAQCQRAGITARIVTGDNMDSARSAATSCGILQPGGDFLVLEGSEFNARIRDADDQVSQQKLDVIWPKLRVLAHAGPTDKYTLVHGIIDSKAVINREMVAVTGDAASDAPALNNADVGFAMGSTAVAKDASDIILTDDSFSSILKAVLWGRNVSDTIAKFLQFQLTVIVVSVIIALVGIFMFNGLLLTVAQWLWLNLIMDTLAPLALAREQPTKDLLKHKPSGVSSPLIQRTMGMNILGHVLYQLVVLYAILFYGDKLIPNVDSGRWAPLDSPPSKHYTILFNAFVLMTLFNLVNSRKIAGERNVFKGLAGNPAFCIVWTGTLIAQFFVVQSGGRWFSTAPLDVVHWMLCVVLGLGELLWAQVLASVPASVLPKFFEFGRGEVQPTSAGVAGESGTKGSGLTHVAQKRVVRAFQAGAVSSSPVSQTAALGDRHGQGYTRQSVAKERELDRRDLPE